MAVRLGVDQYYDYHIDSCKAADPATVRISLRQHIGAPSQPVVQTGDTVSCGQLIGAIPAERWVPTFMRVYPEPSYRLLILKLLFLLTGSS
mgnify:FL=1